MGKDKLFCGVDIGASATKLVLIGENKKIRARIVHPSGVNYKETAQQCLDEAVGFALIDSSQIAHTISTGYGRRNVAFSDGTMTEIHCHGVGCFHHRKEAMTIVDIGGQDNKIIRIAPDGHRLDFKMNRKCAAGTGAFIEEIALRLGIKINHMDSLSQTAESAVELSSFCTVFAKTEILSHLRDGAPVSGIVRGAFLSVVKRIMEMAPLDGLVVLSGGVVAYNPTIAEILSDELGTETAITDDPQFTGALGAALTALERA